MMAYTYPVCNKLSKLPQLYTSVWYNQFPYSMRLGILIKFNFVWKHSLQYIEFNMHATEAS